MFQAFQASSIESLVVVLKRLAKAHLLYFLILNIFLWKNRNLAQRARGIERKGLRPRSGTDHPQAPVGVPVVRTYPVARRRPAVPWAIVPGTAPQHSQSLFIA